MTIQLLNILKILQQLKINKKNLKLKKSHNYTINISYYWSIRFTI